MTAGISLMLGRTGAHRRRERIELAQIPLLAEEGWTRHKKWPFRNGAAGVVSSAKLFSPADFAELTTPSAALSVASQLLVDAAATPPLRGGEYFTFNISSIHSHLLTADSPAI